MNYFVTNEDETITYYASMEAAVKGAKRRWEAGFRGVGVGKCKRVRGEMCYTLLPVNFYV